MDPAIDSPMMIAISTPVTIATLLGFGRQVRPLVASDVFSAGLVRRLRAFAFSLACRCGFCPDESWAGRPDMGSATPRVLLRLVVEIWIVDGRGTRLSAWIWE